MTQISPNPFVLKDAILTLGTDSFEKELSTAELAPTASPQTWKGLSPTAKYQDAPLADWVLNLVLAQDWETSGALSTYLFNNENTHPAFSLKPKSGTGPSFTGTVLIAPGSAGGAGQAFATSSVTLPCDARPLLVPATATAPVIVNSDATAPAAGGTAVAIYGAGFTGATNVKFGTIAAASFRVLSDTLIIAIPVAHAVGSQAITVINATGTSNAQAFSFV